MCGRYFCSYDRMLYQIILRKTEFILPWFEGMDHQGREDLGKRTTLAIMSSSCHNQSVKQRERNAGTLFTVSSAYVEVTHTWGWLCTTPLTSLGTFSQTCWQYHHLASNAVKMIMKITHPFSRPSMKNVLIVLLPCLKSMALKKMENENVEVSEHKIESWKWNCKDLTHWVAKWVVTVVVPNFSCDNSEY